MARFCDEVAGRCGEVVEEEKENGERGEGRELVDRVGEGGGLLCA
jgi:hypothetical protein